VFCVQYISNFFPNILDLQLMDSVSVESLGTVGNCGNSVIIETGSCGSRL
jgi:hypothetical protein